MSTATAAWQLDVLVGSLARAGWGPLHDEIRGARTVLKALADVLPHGSAHGVTTTQQLARVADMSDRWTRHCLAILERVGLLRWRRGWRRVPGRFTICKRTLAAWIRGARKTNKTTTAAVAVATHRKPASRPTQPARPAGPGRKAPAPARSFLNRKSLPDSPLKSEVTAAAHGAPPVFPRPLEQDQAKRQERAPQRGAPPAETTAAPATPEQQQRHLDKIRAILAERKKNR